MSQGNGQTHRDMQEGYAHYIEAGRKNRSPREAHLFALEMAHKGVRFDRSVIEIVMELEGELPNYWPTGD
jgi:hypothetical protein